MNARVLFASRWLAEQAQGEADSGLREHLNTLLADVAGVSVWIAERDGTGGRVVLSAGSPSRLTPSLTPEQWNAVFTDPGRLLIPTVRVTAPDGTAGFGFAWPLPGVARVSRSSRVPRW